MTWGYNLPELADHMYVKFEGERWIRVVAEISKAWIIKSQVVLLLEMGKLEKKLIWSLNLGSLSFKYW